MNGEFIAVVSVVTVFCIYQIIAFVFDKTMDIGPIHVPAGNKSKPQRILAAFISILTLVGMIVAIYIKNK